MALFSVKKNEHPEMRLFACPDGKYFSLWVLVSSGILALGAFMDPPTAPTTQAPQGRSEGH